MVLAGGDVRQRLIEGGLLEKLWEIKYEVLKDNIKLLVI